jgi:adenylosuccinate synthase
VHGNSGPLPKEITWEQLSNRLGKEVVEKTTVTKKVRRIAEWSDDVIEKAITLNAPTHLAITFLDYINPNDEGVDEFEKLSKESRMFLERIENRWNTPIAFLGTGGPNWKVINHEVPSWMDALTAAAAD